MGIFLAVNGTAIAAQAGGDGNAPSGHGPRASAAASLTKQIKALKRRLAALEARAGLAGPQGPQGAQGPQGPAGPSTGAAGGDLTGNYPNPQIAAGVITAAEVAAANKDGLAGIPSLRTLGTGAQQAMPGNATPGGPPSGAAGGALAGIYPNPTLDVSGGPCPNGQELVNVSTQALLTCSAGVYSDPAGNVAAGPTSFPALTGGLLNSALGAGALQSDTSGSSNAAVGNNALADNLNGSRNTAVGVDALLPNTAANNTAVGAGAMVSNTTGANNIAVGESAGADLTTGDNNIDIGSVGAKNEANTIKIGTQGVQNRTFIAGIRGVTTQNANAIPVLIDSSGHLGTVNSSRRVKTDIQALGSSLDGLMKLNPVSFRYRSGPPELHYGLIAEQVARVLPELAVYGEDGLPETVQYQELPVLLLAKIQDQQRQISWLMRHQEGR